MTLQERLRDPAHGFDRNDSHTEDRYVCLCEHLANEAADALDAKDARIKELEGALRPFACKCGPYRCMAHGDDTDPDDCERHRARAALKG